MGQSNKEVVNAVRAIDIDKVPVRYQSLIKKYQGYISEIKNEESTKSFLVRPFLKLLGYDVDSPLEFDPEYVCDVGVKKGEKVDYCVKLSGEPYILIECKDCKYNLTDENISQLYRYFTSGACSAPLGILTNGIEYWFFTDTKVKNRMDTKPFFKCSILDLTEDDAKFLENFERGRVEDLSFIHRSSFEAAVDEWVDQMRSGLSKKFLRYIKDELNPSGLTDEVISDVVVDKLFGIGGSPQVVDEGVSPSDSDIFEDSVWEESTITPVKKSASGICGIFTLDSDSLNSLAGSTLCFVDICDFPYEYTAMYKVLFAIIDYAMDMLDLSARDIIRSCSSMSSPIFYEGVSSDKSSREYRDVFFKASISAKTVIQFAREMCKVLNISASEVRLGLVDKSTKQKLDKEGIDSALGYRRYLENLPY